MSVSVSPDVSAPGVAPAPVHRLWSRLTEAQEGRLFIWCPVALAAGMGVYFALPQEPGSVLAGFIALLGLCCLWLGRRAPLLLLVGVLALGFSITKLRSDTVATPLLPATTGEVAVTGRVMAVDRASAGRSVVILKPAEIQGLPAERLPKHVRLSLPARWAGVQPGDQSTFKARLSPLPAPVMPGGFDYARKLWFEGIGATGRITSEPVITGRDARAGDWLDARLAGLRDLIGQRIDAVLDEPYASFAEALITGERSSIPPEINRSLQISGLFHILSISGLHMWLVAGGVFWAVRATLALVPALALAWPIKKWAAAAAVLAGLFYQLLADSGVATERAFIMVAVVFFAVMVDRPALAVRNLALAAVIILLLEPEAVVDASFQMSFLAVLGLVAFYEAWSRHAAARREEQGRRALRRWPVRLLAWCAVAVGMSLVTSLIAGVSSSIPAAYHFGRLSPYGALANGLAIPVVSFVVMPSALVAVLLMPLGLEWLPLLVLAEGLSLVTLVSDSIARMPGADAIMARPSAVAIVVTVAGFLWLAMRQGPLRWAGLLLMLSGGAMTLHPPAMPDLLVSRAGENVALMSAQGELVPAYARRARFSVEKWLAANGEEQDPSKAQKREGWVCGDGACRAIVKGRSVLYLSRMEGRPLECADAQILITDFPLRGACPRVPLRIDRFDLWRNGAHAVWINNGDVTVTTARQEQGGRPWVVKPEARARVFTPTSLEDDRPLD